MRLRIIHIILFVFCFFNSFSQADSVKLIVEEMPLFEGVAGIDKFREYVINNLRYPDSSVSNKLNGYVMVEFIVDTAGQVTNINVVKGLREDYDKEVVKVISSSPRWTPGKENGKPVNVKFSYPIKFISFNNENNINNNRNKQKHKRNR
jgi:protein TonB